jgi:hypothetical protein
MCVYDACSMMAATSSLVQGISCGSQPIQTPKVLHMLPVQVSSRRCMCRGILVQLWSSVHMRTQLGITPDVPTGQCPMGCNQAWSSGRGVWEGIHQGSVFELIGLASVS